MLKEFDGDYRVMRVVMSSKTPLETLHKIRTNQISLKTFLDMLEFLDVKETIEEQKMKELEAKEKLKRR